jgi:hypothetical protein
MRKAELGVNLADEPCCQQRPVELVEGLEEPSGVAERESPRSAPLGDGASPPTVATAALSPSRTFVYLESPASAGASIWKFR